MPRFARPGAIPEIDLFRPTLMTPGLDPFAQLAEALLSPQTLGPELAGGRFADKAALSHALRGDPETAAALIGEALDKAAAARRAAAHFEEPRPARLLIGVDQAERLFSEASKDADAFAALLQALAGGVAYVMRADAYARFQACTPLLALRVRGATFDLIPPTAAELEEIVARPVAACEPPLVFGHSDSPLPQRLAADAQGGDALPLLQMTLERLYKAREARGDGTLRAEDYNGMAAAVTETADDAMEHLGAGGRDALDALVAGLVVDVASDPVTGEPLPVVVALDRDAFVTGKPDRAALVDAFVEARLLTLEGGARLRPTHDALLRIWPDAAKRVAEMAGLIRARHALAPLARGWADATTSEKPGHLQLSAPLLASGQQLEDRFGEDLGEPLRSFIAEALRAGAAERTRETRRRRLIFGATVAALALMTVLAGAAVWQWRDAVAQKAAVDQARTEAVAQKTAAEHNLALATDAANSLVFDIAQKFRDVSGVPTSLIKSVLDHTRDLQDKLLSGGQSNPDLLRSEAAALLETSDTLLTLGDTKGALDAARKASGVGDQLVRQNPDSADYQIVLSVADEKMGSVEMAQGQLAQALESYQAEFAILDRLAKSNPANADWQSRLSASYGDLGEVEVAQGKLERALGSYREQFAIDDRLANSDPNNAGWQHDLSVASEKVGDVELAQGQLARALESYRKEFAILDHLAKSDPGNAGWRRSLSVAYQNLGNVELAQGDLAQALGSYRADLAITESLAKSDPGNAGWQRDLSVASEKVGDVELAQGQLAEALESYREDFAILDRLAKSDPSNVGWQRSLSVAYQRVGGVELALGQLSQALESYRAALAIGERLAGSDSTNADRRRDLSLSHSLIGDVELQQGQFAEALESYRAGLEIAKGLASSDSTNASWQNDLSLAYQKVGDVELRRGMKIDMDKIQQGQKVDSAEVDQGQLAQALDSYRAGFAIAARLAKSDPSNADWQRNLSLSYAAIGGAEALQGHLAQALESSQASFAITERLAKSDPSNTNWQRDLAMCYAKLASVYVGQNDLAKAREAFEAGRALIVRLVELSPQNANWKSLLPFFDSMLATIKP
jgi:tetratricopeptide (TPR) repeat protein